MRHTALRLVPAAALSAGLVAASLVSAAAPAQAATTFSSGAFGDLNTPAANTWVSGTVNVAGLSGTVSDVNVTLREIRGNVADLDIYLQSPSGQRVWLLSDACAAGTLGGTTLVVDDAAAAAYAAHANDGCGPATVKPTNYGGDDDGGVTAADTLAAFNGAGANGAWTLNVRNEKTDGADDGLVGFDLSIDTVAVAPDTKVIKVNTKKKRKVVIKLASDIPGVYFENKLKSKAGNLDWQRTKKPTKVVGTNLTNGKKVIWVRAVDSAGNVDATPVKVVVKVAASGKVKAKVK